MQLDMEVEVAVFDEEQALFPPRSGIGAHGKRVSPLLCVFFLLAAGIGGGASWKWGEKRLWSSGAIGLAAATIDDFAEQHLGEGSLCGGKNLHVTINVILDAVFQKADKFNGKQSYIGDGKHLYFGDDERWTFVSESQWQQVQNGVDVTGHVYRGEFRLQCTGISATIQALSLERGEPLEIGDATLAAQADAAYAGVTKCSASKLKVTIPGKTHVYTFQAKGTSPNYFEDPAGTKPVLFWDVVSNKWTLLEDGSEKDTSTTPSGWTVKPNKKGYTGTLHIECS